MKTIKSLVIVITLLMNISNVLADYPIVSHRYIADPGAFVYNGRVYVYCSNDDENTSNSSYQMSSIVCVSSSDMKNWTDHGVVFDVPRDASWSNLSWAPSPAYKNGKFYLYFGNGGSAIGVAVSDSPLGPFKDPVGRNIASGSTPGVQPFNGWLFDPMTFIDDDGQAYMYYGGNGDGNLRVNKLNNDMISVNGSAGKFNVNNFFEASWVHKHNGLYYFSYSTNTAAGLRIDYMTSSNPMSGFVYRGVLSPQPPNNNNNNHHANVFFNNQWYQIYHNRIVASQAGQPTTYLRNLAVDAFSHRADGTIVQMVNTVNGLTQVGRLNPYVRVEAETMSDQRGIETEVCSAGGMNLFSLDNNDFTMVEGVDFGTTGATSIATRVASTKTGGTIEIRLGSSTGTLIGTVAVPNTGGNQTWQTVNTSITKTTGVSNVYFVFKGAGTNLFNVDHWTFSTGLPTNTPPVVSITAPLSNATYTAPASIILTATASDADGTISNVQFYNGTTLLGSDATAPYSYTWNNVAAGTYSITARATDNGTATTTSTVVNITVNVPQGPYNNQIHAIPGIIQLENYDLGGNGVAYNDASTGNTGGATFRTTEDVDLETCTDAGGGYNLGFATAGEWLEYTVNVATSGNYDLDFRVACNGTGRTVSVSMDGTNIASNVAIPNTSDWQTWQTVSVKNIALTVGQKVMRLTIGATDYVNLNYVEFKGLVTNLNEDTESNDVSITPNPFGDLGFNVTKKGDFKYYLSNLQGQVVESGTSQNTQIMGVKLNTGTYFLSIEKDGIVTNHKIIKR